MMKDKLISEYVSGYYKYNVEGYLIAYEDDITDSLWERKYELFKDKTINIENLIIEDLGDIREETIKLREHYGFTRQKILQFTIDLYNFYDNDNESENVLVFPGNHDCQTIHGWYKTLNDEYKERLKEFLRRNECYDINVNIGIMQYCAKCKAKIAIITVQDILGLDDSARINIPGTQTKENWSWKLIEFNEFKNRIKDFK